MSPSPSQRIEQLGRSVEALFAYAEAVERAAVRRYRALAEIMAEHHNPELAELFSRFAEIEQHHVQDVGDYARQLGLPETAAQRDVGAGLDGAELMGFEEVHYLHRPYHALTLACRYEQRAAQLYAEIMHRTDREDVRQVAAHFAADEQAHLNELERWLARYPRPEEGWDEDLDPPGSQE